MTTGLNTTAAARKACTGPCGRLLPRSSFSVRRKSRDGLFPLCKECHRQARGPRGREGRAALALEAALLDLAGGYTEPSLADVLARALDEVRQIGATGERRAAQVEAVRRAVLIQGCRRVEEVVEETRLSRWAVDNALRALLEARELETRDAYRLGDEAEEAGRFVTEYHPTAYPRGDGFRRFFRRDEDGAEALEVEP
jgi:L-alanine-DL-glutamate epimerase-like enolase superfamily enzyme